jgi:hypothetical protein
LAYFFQGPGARETKPKFLQFSAEMVPKFRRNLVQVLEIINLATAEISTQNFKKTEGFCELTFREVSAKIPPKFRQNLSEKSSKFCTK